MLTILTYFGYAVIGFGVGGIAFKGKDAKKIMQEFRCFKKVKENEILQINKGKEKRLDQVNKLTKSNIELNKLYNRSLRTIELSEIQLLELQDELSQKPNKAEKETFEDFLNGKG